MNYFNQMTANVWIMAPLLVWILVWKGLALWYAAQRGEKVWYVLLLILNTLGILEIIYIFAVAKRPKAPPAPIQTPPAKI